MDRRIVYTDFKTLLEMSKSDKTDKVIDLFLTIPEKSIVVFGDDLNGKTLDELNDEINQNLPEEIRKEYIFSRMFKFLPNMVQIAGLITDQEVKMSHGKITDESKFPVLLGQNIDWHVNQILPVYINLGENVKLAFIVTEEQKEYLLQKQYKNTITYEPEIGLI